jgi:hypothetical protein
MNTELTYLLKELDNWGEDRLISVNDLKRMIERAFRKEAEDREEIENPISGIAHDGVSYFTL